MAPLDADAWKQFETSLDREVLAAERLRVTIVAVMVSALLLMSFVVLYAFPRMLPDGLIRAGGP